MLVIGPPGSGKTHACLERLATAVAQGRGAEVRLVTPTASMAQHLLHQLARRGLTIPGDLVLSLDELLDRIVPEEKTPTPAEADWLLIAAIQQASGAEPLLGPLHNSPGVRRRTARAIQDLQTARCSPEKFKSLAEDKASRVLASIYALYEGFLRSYGLVWPAERLSLAAQHAAIYGCRGIKQIDFDGFVHLSAGERDLMQSLVTGGVDVRITLVEEPPSGSFPLMARTRLEDVRRPRPQTEVVQAADLLQEVEEIARRILETRRSTGEPLHHFGVILRSPQIYAATIQSVFEGFGIPYRMRRPQALAEHPVGRFARKLLAAAAEGFEAQPTLTALRMTPCTASAAWGSDRWDFAVRERLPGDGLDTLHRDATAPIEAILATLEPAAAWRTERAPAVEWRKRCEGLLSDLIRYPEAPDGLSAARVLELRAFAAAVSQLAEAFAETERLLLRSGHEKIRLSSFLEVFDSVLALTELRVSDTRRDVVNVISAHEARQWELPHVFVAGLVEGWFPQNDQDDLMLPDKDRKRLRLAGFEVRTRAEAVADEPFLFEIAKTRATRSLTISYPLADRSGAPLLRSFLLEEEAGDRPALGAKARRAAAKLVQRRSGVDDPRLLNFISGRFPTFSPSTIDSFLQCPYKLFAGRTLSLDGPPKRPADRLDGLWKGSVIHDAVAEWSGSGDADIGAILGRVFNSRLADACVKSSFATELLKAMMERDLERFARHPSARSMGSRSAHEEELRYVIDLGEGPGYEVKGRIDRYDVLDGDAVLVIDYKHSSDNWVRTLKKRHDKGQAVQLLLYLAGLAQQGRQPAGALLWGLRGKTTLAGWALEPIAKSVEGKNAVEGKSPAFLAELLSAAQEATTGAVGRIRSGCIEAAPIDKGFCKSYCDFRDLCRIEL